MTEQSQPGPDIKVDENQATALARLRSTSQLMGFFFLFFLFANLITLISLRINLTGALFTTKFIAKPQGKCSFFFFSSVQPNTENVVTTFSAVSVPGLPGLWSDIPKSRFLLERGNKCVQPDPQMARKG